MWLNFHHILLASKISCRQLWHKYMQYIHKKWYNRHKPYRNRYCFLKRSFDHPHHFEYWVSGSCVCSLLFRTLAYSSVFTLIHRLFGSSCVSVIRELHACMVEQSLLLIIRLGLLCLYSFRTGRYSTSYRAYHEKFIMRYSNFYTKSISPLHLGGEYSRC